MFQNLQKIGGKKKYFFCKFANSSVQYNSIILRKKIQIKKIRKLRIGFVGRLSNEKGLNKFLEIAYANQKNIYSIYLVRKNLKSE